MNNPNPTTRFVLEPSLECNIKCKFCYHLHRYDTWARTRKTFDEVKADIDAGKKRGNDYMDITGGEPTIYPHIVDTVRYALDQGIKTCIITNGIVNRKRARELMGAGIDDWLISRHGLRDTHNFITNYPAAYDKQLEFLQVISEWQFFRFNCVITKFNQHDLPRIAEELIRYPVRIVNFINFNPHHEWINHSMQAREFIADLRAVELSPAIEILEGAGIIVNVRYFPVCRLPEQYRRCICNDLHVTFDPYEWDYQIEPKTFDAFRKWGVDTSNCIEEKGEPCCGCDLQRICGGINKGFHKFSNEVYPEVCLPVQNFQGDKNDFYHYRRGQVIL